MRSQHLRAAVRALAQWVLDYPQDAADEGFPFDLPYLDLYRRRCRQACRAADRFLYTPPDDGQVRKALKRLHRIVEPVHSQVPFQRPAAILETRAQLFQELRQALRLKVKLARNQPVPLVLSDADALRDVRASLELLTASFRQRRP